MSAVLKELERHTWRMAPAVEQDLVNAGRLEPGTSLAAVLRLAQSLRQTPTVAIISTDAGECLVPADRAADVTRLWDRIRQADFEVARIQSFWNPVSRPWRPDEIRALKETVLPELCRLHPELRLPNVWIAGRGQRQ
jgi:hypothetical protein